MFENISQKQVELLNQELIVPIAVSDITTYDLVIEPDMQYGLHMALSEIDPDSALLAIALCIPSIADKAMEDAPIAAILKNEAKNLINDYAPTWLYHHQNPPLSEENYFNIMKHVPEDLESLADLLDVLCSEIDDEDSIIHVLANLLSIQARAHMDIAEFVLGELKNKQSGDFNGISIEEVTAIEATSEKPQNHDNIILFPGTNA